MTDIRIDKERKAASNEIYLALKKLLYSGKSLNIASFVQEITLNYLVNEKFVRGRIALFKASDPRVKEEEGELWVRLDSKK